VLVHKAIEHRPRNLLQKAMKNDSLVRHGVDPFFRVQMIRNQLEPNRINAVHLFKHRSCQTPVRLDPAIPLTKAQPCPIIGIAGSSPAMADVL
jgi:hypothetical protein